MTLAIPQTLPAKLRHFAMSQPREEIARQFSVVHRIERQRRLLLLVPFVVGAVFLPVWVCVLLFALDTASEVAGYRLLRGLDPEAQPRRYLTMLACYVAAQVSYCLMPVLCWQMDLPMTHAFAVGATMVTLVHLTTVRTVHLPLGLAGGITVIVASALGNSWYWIARGDVAGLAVSSIALAGAAWFAILIIQSAHRQQREMARDRAAAQAADQAKLRFLAQMSHELRTPLNAILGIGNAELAVAERPESRIRLEALLHAAEGLAVMLDDILDMSAVQAGELPIRPRALDLRAEIDATVAMFRQQVLDAGLILRLTLHDSLPRHARLDGQRLRQCLSNMLSNAVKHTPTGMITVYAYEIHPGMLAIKVSDSGPGVPEALREKIFEPFYRGPHTLPGSGLGMSIGRTLARRMGGDLILQPSTSGADFLLTLAFAPASAADLPPPQTVAEGSLAGLRVLVVDDVATNRHVAATFLRRLGAEPSEADSGAAALEIVQGLQPPDVILMDLLMPGLDGTETLRQIRAMPGRRGALPVIAMSADMTEAARQGSDWSFDGFLGKPLGMANLSELLLPFARQPTFRPPDGEDTG